MGTRVLPGSAAMRRVRHCPMTVGALRDVQNEHWHRRSSRSARLDHIYQHSHLAYFDLHGIAGLHPNRGSTARADAARGAGDDDVARLERGESGNVVDEPRDAVNHLLGGGVLHDLTVEPRLE